jgi:hypothetical protein
MKHIKTLVVALACAIGLAQAYAPASKGDHHIVLPVVEVHSGAGSTVVAKAIQDVKILGAGVDFAVVMSPAVVLEPYEVAGVDFQTGITVAKAVTTGHSDVGVAVASDLSLQDLQNTLQALTDAVPEGSKAELETTKSTGGI